MVQGELLVVLARPAPEWEPPRGVRPVHRGNGHVVVVAAEDPAQDLLASDPDVLWAGTDPPARVLDSLAADDLLAVEAWRVRAAPKARPGEGLSWDAPGWTPPDPPARSG
jgi:hypothetical protein